MATAIINPKFYGQDKDGKPLAFGFLYAYVAGTKTPQITYKDESETVKNTHPIKLNAEGYAEVYISGVYDLVLLDKNLNEVWQAKGISSRPLDDWVNCTNASYIAGNQFSLVGDQTSIFTVGRAVRLKTDDNEYFYTAVLLSQFSEGITTITTEDSFVEINTIQACTEIAQESFSIEDILPIVPYSADNIEAAEQIDVEVGQLVTTKGYYLAGDGGGADYIVVAGDTGIADGGSYHDLYNGNQIKLIYGNTVNSKQFGSKDNEDNTIAYNNMINNTMAENLEIIDQGASLNRVTLSRGYINITSKHELSKVVQDDFELDIVDRALFMADGLSNITINIRANLKGEGSRKIGESGFILNEYNTVSFVSGVSGPANAVIYAVRCSYLNVKGGAKNSGESGYLFRNCGNINVDVECSNISGAGVEMSFPVTDGSAAIMPIRENYKVVCRAEHINDLKLGAGNGTAVGMAGNASNEVFRNFDITVYGNKNSREIHQEFNGGSRIENFKHTVYSRNALQGGVVTQGRNGIIRGEIINAGCAGSGAVNDAYPSMYGFLASTGSDDIDCKLFINSTNDDGFTVLTDGIMTAGSNVLTSASASFPSNITGKHVVVEGANPRGNADSNTALEAYVISRVSENQLLLDLNAQVSVSSAKIGYGTGLRNPLTMNGLGRCCFDGSVIIGGVFSGLPSEPDAAAIYFGGGSKESSARDVILKSPGLISTATAPVGMSVSASYSAPVLDNGSLISGFDSSYKGFSFNSNASRFKLNRKLTQEALPGSVIDTYGTIKEFLPRTQSFDAVMSMSIEFDTLGSETITTIIEFVFIDGGTNTLTLTSASNEVIELTTAQLAALHQDNQKIISFNAKSKSSIVDSTARVRISYLAIEG